MPLAPMYPLLQRCYICYQPDYKQREIIVPNVVYSSCCCATYSLMAVLTWQNYHSLVVADHALTMLSTYIALLGEWKVVG